MFRSCNNTMKRIPTRDRVFRLPSLTPLWIWPFKLSNQWTGITLTDAVPPGKTSLEDLRTFKTTSLGSSEEKTCYWVADFFTFEGCVWGMLLVWMVQARGHGVFEGADHLKQLLLLMHICWVMWNHQMWCSLMTVLVADSLLIKLDSSLLCHPLLSVLLKHI